MLSKTSSLYSQSTSRRCQKQSTSHRCQKQTMQRTVLEDSTFLFFEDTTCRGGCSGEQLVRPCPANALAQVLSCTMPRYMFLNLLSFKQCAYAWCVDGTRKLHWLLWKSQHLKKWRPVVSMVPSVFNQMSSCRICSNLWLACYSTQCSHAWLAGYSTQCSHAWLASYSTQTVFSPLIGWLQYTVFSPLIGWLQYTVNKALHLCWIPSQRIKSYHPNISFKS